MPATQNQVTRISAYGLVIDDDRILLCRISNRLAQHAGSWTLPSGGLEFGEDPAFAMEREVKEGTGLVVRSAGLAGIDWLVIEREGTTFHSLRILYFAEALAGELSNEVDGTTDRCDWHPNGNVQSLPTVDLVRRARHLLSATEGPKP